jgi:hypothetical protein
MNAVNTTSHKAIWAGRILTGVVAIALMGSAITKIAGVPKVVEGLTHAGIPVSAVLPTAVLELTCLGLYLFPRATLLGALLITGFLGGGTLTHVIGRENIFPPLLISLLSWAGAYLRIPELRSLLPLIKENEGIESYSRVGHA